MKEGYYAHTMQIQEHISLKEFTTMKIGGLPAYLLSAMTN